MANPEYEYEVTDEEAESEFKEIKSKEADKKTMVEEYEEDERDEEEEKKKQSLKAKDNVIVETSIYKR